MNKSVVIIILFIIFTLVLSGCSSTKPEKPCCLCNECHEILQELRRALPPPNEYREIESELKDREIIRYALGDLFNAISYYKFFLSAKNNEEKNAALHDFYSWFDNFKEKYAFLQCYQYSERGSSILGEENLYLDCLKTSQGSLYNVHYLLEPFLGPLNESTTKKILDDALSEARRRAKDELSRRTSAYIYCEKLRDSSVAYRDICERYTVDAPRAIGNLLDKTKDLYFDKSKAAD